jgi:hypothetical protein
MMCSNSIICPALLAAECEMSVQGHICFCFKPFPHFRLYPRLCGLFIAASGVMENLGLQFFGKFSAFLDTPDL